jgi:branched-chain amino acid transport system substrate-binding protein
MFRLNKRAAVLAVLVVVAILVPACGPKAPEIEDEWGVVVVKPGENVRIGAAMALSGDLAVLGEDIKYGIDMILEDIPDIEGFPVEIVYEDDMCTGEGGTAVGNKFAADPTILAVVGHMCTMPSVPCKDIYEKAGIPMVSPSATAAQLTADCGPIFNRIAFNDNKQGEEAVKYMADVMGIKNIAVMHDTTTYGKALADYVSEHWPETGGTVTGYEGITPGDTDFRAVLTKIAAGEPELIYFGGFFTEAAYMAQQKNEVGMEDVIIFSDDGTKSDAFIEAAGEAAEGNYATSVATEETDKLQDFKERFLDKYGVAVGELGPFAPNGYDSAAVVLHALSAVAIKGDDGNLYIGRKALADAIRSTKDLELLGGAITCDECGDCAAAQPQFNVVQGGQWVIAEH